MKYCKKKLINGQSVASVTAKKCVYLKPLISIYGADVIGNLMQTSFPGQHNPSQPGTGPTPTRAGLRHNLVLETEGMEE